MDQEVIALAETQALAHAAVLAHAAGDYDAVCVMGEPVFWLEYEKALRPGHIYSHAGREEFRISRCCEFHFDKWFKEEE